jgi:hypothetical protein
MATTATSVGDPPSRKRISSFNLPSDHVVTEPERRACTSCNRLRSLHWFTNLRAKGKDKLSRRCFACRGNIAQIQECTELDRQQAVVREKQLSTAKILPSGTPARLPKTPRLDNTFARVASRSICTNYTQPAPFSSSWQYPPFVSSPLIAPSNDSPPPSSQPLVSTLTPPIHFRRGEDPQASPHTTAARRTQLAIERRHRMGRRAGRSPSTTPSLQTLREGPIPNTPCHREAGFATASPFATPPEHPPSHLHDSQPFISSFGMQFDSSYHDSPRPGRPRRHGSLRLFSGSRSSSLAPHLQPDDSRSFYCERCTVNRPRRVVCIQTDCTDLADYHCKYCHPDNVNDPATQNMDEENGDAIWCTTGNHEASRCHFTDDNGRTYSSCLHCRRSIDRGVRMGVKRAMQDDGDNITPSQAIRDASRCTLQDSDPPMDPTDPATLSNPALSERD